MATRRTRKTAATKSAPARLVGYVRVSSDEQADEGFSLDAQRAKIAAYAAGIGAELVMIEADEGLSASTLSRPALQRAFAMIDSKAVDGILVAKLDRLTRSLRDLLDLVEGRFSSAHLVSVEEKIDTSSANGRLTLKLLGMISEWEREAIAERTAAAMAHMRAQGLYTGGKVRYGFSQGTGGALVENPAEQATIARARELHAEGLSLRNISARLAGEGRLSRGGKGFDASAISQMVAAN